MVPSTLEAMRATYSDALANFRCSDKQIYNLTINCELLSLDVVMVVVTEVMVMVTEVVVVVVVVAVEIVVVVGGGGVSNMRSSGLPTMPRWPASFVGQLCAAVFLCVVMTVSAETAAAAVVVVVVVVIMILVAVVVVVGVCNMRSSRLPTMSRWPTSFVGQLWAAVF